ncbi:gcy-9 [Symbiodinium sp. CCMP2592]|nr:gcy-9 [Symbiodinium sp. CCMP2592]
MLMIQKWSHWQLWLPYIITYAVEWPLLTYILRHPSMHLYLAVLGFDSIISLVAADPMMLSWFESDVNHDNTSYQVLYFDMIYVLMSVMYYPTVNHLTIFTLGRTLVFAMYLAIVLYTCANVNEVAFAHRIFDISVGVVAMLMVNAIAIAQKKHLWKLQRHQAEVELKRRYVCSKMFNVFNFMVPPFYVKRLLRYPGMVIANRVDRVSILFIVLLDFDKYSQSMSPSKLFHFLNETFTNIDVICAQHGVTKIETVGEEYVCGVGVSPTDQDEDHVNGHSSCLARLLGVAFELQTMSASQDTPLVKMGIHTGPVVAGVVGRRLPRFRLFGDTMNMAARMMQKSLPGEVQFGEETKQHLPQWAIAQSRGWVEMKGKGQVMTYLLRGSAPEELSSLSWVRETSDHISMPTTLLVPSFPNGNQLPSPRRLGAREGNRAKTDGQAMSRHEAERRDRSQSEQPMRRSTVRLATPSSPSPHRLAGIMKELLGMKSEADADTDLDADFAEDILSVAHEVTKQQSSQMSMGGVTWADVCKRVQWLWHPRRWAAPRGFPDSEDEEFTRWFHLHYSCGRLLKELRKQAFSSLLATIGTTIYSLFKLHSFRDGDVGQTLKDIMWFLMCRLAMWLLILVFWFFAARPCSGCFAELAAAMGSAMCGQYEEVPVETVLRMVGPVKCNWDSFGLELFRKHEATTGSLNLHRFSLSDIQMSGAGWANLGFDGKHSVVIKAIIDVHKEEDDEAQVIVKDIGSGEINLCTNESRFEVAAWAKMSENKEAIEKGISQKLAEMINHRIAEHLAESDNESSKTED